jgi:hypothetical protein
MGRRGDRLSETQQKPFMNMWTVYYDPRDYPGKYVVRRFDIFPGRAEPSAEHYVADTLDEIRQHVPPGMDCLMRSEQDEEQIVETWL